MVVASTGLGAEGLAALEHQNQLVCSIESDSTVRSSVKEALRATGYQALTRLKCEVAGDVVSLRGELPTFFLKQVAQEAVRQVKGIREVRNMAIVL